MGQKIHPRGVRLGYVYEWQSKWFAPRQMPELIGEDFRIRKMVADRFQQASVSSSEIERAGPYLKLSIHTSRPGIVIGRRGADIEVLKKDIEALTGRKVFVNVAEIKVAELDPRLVGQSIAQQLEKRISHKRAIKRAMERTMQAGALGIKVLVGGRLGGAEIARRECFRKGSVPLQTLSADIDYGLTEAYTTMGKIGIKVWIFKKMCFTKTHRELIDQARKLSAERQESAGSREAEAQEQQPDVNIA